MRINPQLEAKYINDVLASLRIKCRVTQVVSAPSFYYYGLFADSSERLARLQSAAPDIESRIHAMRAKHASLGVDKDGVPTATTVRFSRTPLALEVNRPDAVPLEWAKRQWAMRPFTALAGRYYEASGSYPVVADITNHGSTHMLVAGTTGSGKSVLVEGMVLGFAESTSPAELQFVFVDLDSDHFQVFASLPHTHGVADTHAAAVDAVDYVVAQMSRKTSRRTMLVVDELALLLRDDAQMVARLESIAERGRKHGVHLLLATQKPLAVDVGTHLKSNVGWRACGAVLSHHDSSTALNFAGGGAEKLPGNGAFILRTSRTVRRFQAYWLALPSGVVRSVRTKWGGGTPATQFAPPAPVHDGKVNFSEVEPPAPPLAPVRTGAMHHPAPPVAPPPGAKFPLPEKRPLTDDEAEQVQAMADDLSKNELMRIVYGSKSTRYKQWIDDALSRDVRPNVIRLDRRRAS